MKKYNFKKFTLSIILIISVLIISAIFAQKFVVESKLDKLPTKILNTLPVGSKYEVVSGSSSFFSHASLIKYIIPNKDNNLNLEFFLEYKVNNDFFSMIFGNADFIINFKLGGEILKTYEVKSSDTANITIVGKIENFTSVSADFTVSPIEVSFKSKQSPEKEFQSFTIATDGAHGNLYYKFLEDNISLNISDGSVFAKLSNEKIYIMGVQNFTLATVLNIKELKSKTLNLNLKLTADNVQTNIKGASAQKSSLEFRIKGEEFLDGSIDASFNNINFENSNYKYIQMSFEFDNLNKNLLKTISNKKNYADLSFEDRANLANLLKEEVSRQLNNGFSVNVKKFQTDNSLSQVDSKLLIKIDPIKPGQNIESNTTLDFNLNYFGDKSKDISEFLEKDFGVPSVVTFSIPNKLKIDMSFSNEDVVLNKIKNPIMFKELFDGFMEVLDQELNYKVRDTKPFIQPTAVENTKTIYIKEYDPLKYIPDNNVKKNWLTCYRRVSKLLESKHHLRQMF